MQKSFGRTFDPQIVTEDEKTHEELCRLYLKDYVAAMYQPTMDDENEVIVKYQYHTVWYIVLSYNQKHVHFQGQGSTSKSSLLVQVSE